MMMEALTKRLNHLSLQNVALFVLPLSVALIFVRLASARRRRRTTRLKGPPSKSYIFGVTKDLFSAPDVGVVYEDWEKEYGAVFAMPAALGSQIVVLCDPKAVAHMYAKDTFTYQQIPAARIFLEAYFGRNVLWAEAETH